MTDLQFNTNGTFSLTTDRKAVINPSPIGVLVCDGIAYAPQSATVSGEIVTVQYPTGECVISVVRKQGYWKMVLVQAPDNVDGFIFGPYKTAAKEAGEILGAAWHEDGSAVCIQSLMPKVVSGSALKIKENRTGISALVTGSAAVVKEDGATLQCCVKDRSRPEIGANPEMGGARFTVEPISGEDASIVGAAAALLYAENADALLDAIGEMEIAEGLPHPMFNGVWAKKNPAVSSIYLIIDGAEMTSEERIEAAEKAGVTCVYFSDVIERWGHFTVNKNSFPGGAEEVASFADRAKKSGIMIGAHSLSNFIHTNDPYVSPVPSEHLFYMDKTTLAADISAEDDCITLTEDANYTRKSTLNLFRIGDELIRFSGYDTASKKLTGCTRGAYGTTAAPHSAGDTVRRLADHNYSVVFPDMELQDEVADNLGKLIRDCGIRKFSFDGLEGTTFSGHGDYAYAHFVKRVCDIVGNELICDGSGMSHYSWHAMSYGNWGEPWYDSNHRGAMHSYRARNQLFFRRNLVPGMFGWYTVGLSAGRYEATTPEIMEYILSRSAAFDAGIALSFHSITMKGHGLTDKYLDLIRIWGDFRLHADIPDSLRKRLQTENSDWHLEEDGDGWILTELILRQNDMAYTDFLARKEVVYVGENVSMTEDGTMLQHSNMYGIDVAAPALDEPEPLHFRIRVGEHGCGKMKDLSLNGQMNFSFVADGGDYLEYFGGTELYHYDADFRLKEVVAGSGSPVITPACPGGGGWVLATLRYLTDNNPNARYEITEIRSKEKFKISRKK